MNHFFEILDITPLQELMALGKIVKIFILEYNNKFYLENNAVNVKGAQVENVFKNDVPYIMDLSFSKYDIQKKR